jgi:galactose mutarotase-like enzyme
MILENERLKIRIAEKGAELQSVFHKETGIEYMWQADPAYWPKHSPVLFPIVGVLKDNQYTYAGQTYQLGRHGFAREKDFLPDSNGSNSGTFTLKSDAGTKAVYPFDFVFTITYTLESQRVRVQYNIENTGSSTLYFSVGAHPAFNVPVSSGRSFDDYYLLFEKQETASRQLLSEAGLVRQQTEPLLHQANTLPLSKPLFHKDALVFEGIASEQITLRSEKDEHGIRMGFRDFPFLGIWSKEGANFVCIEPWCGIADSEAATGDITVKKGIQALEPGAAFDREWWAEFY